MTRQLFLFTKAKDIRCFGFNEAPVLAFGFDQSSEVESVENTIAIDVEDETYDEFLSLCKTFYPFTTPEDAMWFIDNDPIVDDFGDHEKADIYYNFTRTIVLPSLLLIK